MKYPDATSRLSRAGIAGRPDGSLSFEVELSGELAAA